MNPKNPERHPFSSPELSLKEFRALVVQDSVRESKTIAEAASSLGTSVKTIHVYMDNSRPTTTLRKKSLDPNDLPLAFKNQKPDRPLNNFRTMERLEVSVWVDPEERDHYYNLDFPWGTYSRMNRPSGKEHPLPHALGYGDDL